MSDSVSGGKVQCKSTNEYILLKLYTVSELVSIYCTTCLSFILKQKYVEH